jgi:hypothetical protein
VYALDPSYVKPWTGYRNQAAVHIWGYRLIAGSYGFKLGILHPTATEPLPLSEACPTLIWAEHMLPRGPAIDQLPQQPFAQSPQVKAALQSAHLYLGRRGSIGFVLELPPARSLSTAGRPSDPKARVAVGPGRTG